MTSASKSAVFQRVSASFEKQGLMRTLGATLASVEPGAVQIVLTPHPGIFQQHGFVHAGAVSAVADSAAGFAALSLMPAGTGVLTTEFKINLLAPAKGDLIRVFGSVIKSGRTLTMAKSEIFTEIDGEPKLIAFLTSTLMTIEGRTGISD